jgi:diacylglycerol O-acyltransferase / wax synthase
MPAREPLSHVDTAWLRMDRPNNLMQIVGVMLFDGKLDFARLQASVADRMLRHRRLRQCAVETGNGWSWVDDTDFDLDNHLRRAVLPGAAGKAELQHFVADLAAQPLNPDRPLWEMTLVETSLGGPALVTRFHHCIADGIALVGVILSMADGAPDAPGGETKRPVFAPEDDDHPGDVLAWQAFWQPVTQAMATSIKISTTLWTQYIGLLTNPLHGLALARLGTGVASEIVRLATLPDDSRTRFKGKPGSIKRVAWCDPIPLPEVKAVGRVLGCSVNDMLLSAVAGALREYLLACGDPVDGVELRAMVPVNMRGPEDAGKLGNKFGLVALELPVGEENPLARLYTTRRRMERLKGSLEAAVTLKLLDLVGMAPKFVQEQVLDLLASKATAVMTNVPGPQQALYLAGARLAQPLFWVPQSGDIGMGVSILSYDGKVQFGLITDRKLVPDPEKIVTRFAHEFEKLLLLVLMEPWGRLADPAAVEAAVKEEARALPA